MQGGMACTHMPIERPRLYSETCHNLNQGHVAGSSCCWIGHRRDFKFCFARAVISRICSPKLLPPLSSRHLEWSSSTEDRTAEFRLKPKAPMSRHPELREPGVTCQDLECEIQLPRPCTVLTSSLSAW